MQSTQICITCLYKQHFEGKKKNINKETLKEERDILKLRNCILSISKVQSILTVNK